MNISDMIKNTADQIIEPEADELEHIRDFSSLAEHLQEAENDYEEAMKTFRETDPGSRYIMDIAAQTEEAAKALISRALAYFTHYQASQEDKQQANQIIDRVTKDASIRRTRAERRHPQGKAEDHAFPRPLRSHAVHLSQKVRKK